MYRSLHIFLLKMILTDDTEQSAAEVRAELQVLRRELDAVTTEKNRIQEERADLTDNDSTDRYSVYCADRYSVYCADRYSVYCADRYSVYCADRYSVYSVLIDSQYIVLIDTRLIDSQYIVLIDTSHL